MVGVEGDDLTQKIVFAIWGLCWYNFQVLVFFSVMLFWVPNKKVKVLRLEEHVNAWILGSQDLLPTSPFGNPSVSRYGVKTEATADASKHVYVA